MKNLSKWLGLLLLCFSSQGALAGEPWQDALARMPLGVPQNGVIELNRTNCVPLMLDAFQSNGVVKALIFMPGATDELSLNCGGARRHKTRAGASRHP